jgi:nitroreductase
VALEDLITCIKGARLAPSDQNLQPFSFVLLNEGLLVKKIAPFLINGEFNHWCQQCQAFLIILEEEVSQEKKKNHDLTLMDIGIVALQFCLVATELDLGTCMIGVFDEQKIREQIDIRATGPIRLIIGIGYPQNSAPVRKRMRKPLERLVQIIERKETNNP